MFRRVRVNKTDKRPSRKVVAGALATLVTAVAMRYGVELDKFFETVVEGVVGFVVAYLVPEAE